MNVAPTPNTLRSPWRCLSCGGEAVVVGPSLEPGRPLGRCLELVGPYRKPAHGGKLVPLTDDPQELRDMLAWRRQEDQRRAHSAHIGARLIKSCHYCAELREAMLQRSGRGPT